MSTLFGSIRYSKRYRSYSKTSRVGRIARSQEAGEEIVARYRAPAWLMNRAWEVQVSRVISGWTLQPRTFNVIPRSSPLFILVEVNNVEGIRELFQEKKASPYDCNELGITALHVSYNLISYSCSLRADFISSLLHLKIITLRANC